MSVKKRVEELNSRFADKLSEKGVSADASDTTTELINKIDEIEVGIKVDPYVGDYVAEPTITDQKFSTKNLLMLDDFVVKKIPSELLAKEEQEKDLIITKNGSYEVLPDENKVLSGVSIDVDVKDETLAEIETAIDESGVLDSTEGTVEEKVDKVIHFAEVLKKTFGLNFYDADELTHIDFYIDWLGGVTNTGTISFQYTTNLERIKGIDCSKLANIRNLFTGSSIKTIDEPFDVSKFSEWNMADAFNTASNLINIRFIAECIKASLSFAGCSKLSAESIQSIIDGLAYVETAQTLTLHKAIVLTDEQKATINAKGWTLAQ